MNVGVDAHGSSVVISLQCLEEMDGSQGFKREMKNF